MLFRKHIVSTRALLQLAVATAFFVGGVGAALAAGSNVGTATTPPLLVPYTIISIAGSPQYLPGSTSVGAGFAGEAGAATPKPTFNSSGVITGGSAAAVLSGPFGQAVDSAGNVYITDTGNDIIREVNAQTGNITTIGGVTPKGCSGSSCSQRTTGCSDGVLAAGNPLGSGLQGIAVDAYGNVYFVDSTTSSVSVIYRGGTQVANFITLVNPAGVAKSGGKVLPGYVYHVAGAVNLTTCGGSSGPTDNGMAFTDTSVGTATATLRSPSFLTLDGAGNIYVADISNATVRVINTQATPQTFFQYTIQPGYVRSITNCNAALTTPCPTATTTATANTGINGPVNAIVYNSQYREAEVDAFGNIYQLNGTGSGTGPPGIYSATAYAGGGPLTNLLTVEAPLLASSFGPTATPPNAPAELPLTYGNSYISIGNTALTSTLPGSFPDVLAVTNEDLDIRPSSMLPDVFGTFWFNDNHYPELERIDQYTGLATDVIGSASQRATASVSGIYTSPASFTNPWQCVYGATGNPWTLGPATFDPQGDGCPAILAAYSGGVHSSVSDGLGNIYLGDGGEHLVRELLIGNVFPATAVGTATGVTQAIQVHFNAANPPKLGASVPDAQMTGAQADATTFTIGSGADFTINTTTAQFPMGSVISSSTKGYAFNATTANFQMWTGLPTCTQLGAAPVATVVTDYDCLVYVTFNPQAPGARQAQLKVTTASGLVYNFPLYGVGTGGQLAVDGGAPTAIPITGTALGTTAGIAVTQSNIAYIADPTNNRVVSCKPAATCTTQGTIGTGLKGPMGVATDVAGNVYISDTGNNRVLKVNPIDGTQTVLGNYAWIPGSICDGGSTEKPCPAVGLAAEPGASVSKTTAPPQYAFNAPQGLAVDVWNNVYVADTGNAVVVEIPSNPQLGGAAPLLAYSGAPQFKNPVAVAVDSVGNIYVADTKNPSAQIVKLPPGGGDLITVPGTQFPALVGSGIKAPNGVAVDGAGNVYVSDSSANAVVEVPAASGPGSTPFALNFPGLKVPSGVALDASGNLYVADTGNKQVLFDARTGSQINVSFGNVPQNLAAGAQPICSGTILSNGFNIGNTSPCVLTVTNIGTSPVTFGSSVLSNGGGNPAYSISNTTCPTTTPLASGLTCTLTTTFTPTADTTNSVSVTVNAAAGSGTSPKLSLQANGQQPLVNIVLTSSLGLAPPAGGTDTITATVTQPHIAGNTPTGSVTFTYVVNAANGNANNCGTGGTVTSNLSGAGGTATATFNLPVLAPGVQYTVTANYNPGADTFNSATQATPILIAVPGTPVTATVTSTAAQLTFVYGSPAPVPVGTVTPTPASPIVVTFGSAAKATTPIGSYPVVVSFSGAGSCAYGFPPSVFSTGGAAVVQENPAALTYTIPNFTAQFGAPNISFGATAVITGAQNGDGFGATFVIGSGSTTSSTVAVGTYPVTPTLIGPNVGNYTVTAKPATLTVTKAGTSISVSLSPTAVANTAAGASSASLSISVATTVPAGIGTPSGSVTVSDVFTPITATGLGTPNAAVTSTLPLLAGAATGTVFAPAVSTAFPNGTATPGLHQFSFSYSGDSNFQASTLAPSATAAACTPSALAVNCLLVDYPDFTLTSTTGPIAINPGTIPSGNGLLPAPNQSTAFPQTAVLFINGVLGFSGQVTLACTPQNPLYVSCFMTPPAVSITSSAKTAATVIAVETPATLPLGFKLSELRTSASRTVLAFLPLGILAFCVRRRRRLSKALWTLMVVCAIGAGMTGCGGNQIDFYTPIPTGAQTVTVTATWVGSSTQPSGTRSFIVPITID